MKAINGKLHRLKNDNDFLTILESEIDKNTIFMGGTNFGEDIKILELNQSANFRDISCLIVSSISRRVFRYLINAGVPVIISQDATNKFRGGEKVEIDLSKGKVSSKKTTINFSPYSEELLGIIESGGLIPYTKMNINR